jgi:hypothetical protein
MFARHTATLEFILNLKMKIIVARPFLDLNVTFLPATRLRRQ